MKASQSVHCCVDMPVVLGACSRWWPVLHAPLVDSLGLDKAAPSPRDPHDPANTGNAGTGLSEWTCL
jgi:hypothetical protein